MEKAIMYGKRIILALVLAVGFPLFFGTFTDLRFFWSILAVLGICSQAYLLVRRKEGRNIHLKNAAVLMLSVIMANNLYSWQTLVSVIPVLADIPIAFLLLSALALILAAILCAILCNAYVRHKKKYELPADCDSDLQKISNPIISPVSASSGQNYNHVPGSADSASGSSSEINNAAADQTVQTKAASQSADQQPLPARHVFGYILGTITIVVLAIIAGYAMIKNITFFEKFSMQSLSLLFYATTWYIAVLISIVLIGYLTINFFIRAKQLMKGVIHKESTLHDKNLLLCMSFVVALAICMIAPRKTFNDLLDFFSGSEDLMTLLFTVCQLVLTGIMTMTLNTLFCSMLQPEGRLHKSAEAIFNKILNIFGILINSILDTALQVVNKMPSFEKLIINGIKNVSRYFYEMFISGQDDDDSLTA